MSYSRALEDPLEAGEKLDQRARMGNRGRGGLVDQKACRLEILHDCHRSCAVHYTTLCRARREREEGMEVPARMELLDFPDLLGRLALQGDMM